MGLTRRDFLRGSGAIAVAGGLTGANRYASPAGAAVTSSGLCDPMIQPLFATPVPNALDPGFVYRPQKGRIKVGVGQRPDGRPFCHEFQEVRMHRCNGCLLQHDFADPDLVRVARAPPG